MYVSAGVVRHSASHRETKRSLFFHGTADNSDRCKSPALPHKRLPVGGCQRPTQNFIGCHVVALHCARLRKIIGGWRGGRGHVPRRVCAATLRVAHGHPAISGRVLLPRC